MEFLLSVIIPTYNCEEYLDATLGSVLQQLPEDEELIIVDDGSTDGTREMLSSYEGRQPNLRVFRREHRGASGARNAGLDEARGRYITFLDCDDQIREDFLRESRPLLLSDADLVIFGIEWVPLEGSSEYRVLRDTEFRNVHDFADEYVRTRKLLLYSNCNKFYRRSIIEGRPGGSIRFDEAYQFGEDRLFNYRYLEACGEMHEGRSGSGRIMTSSLISLRYIQHGNDSMSSRYIPGFYDLAMKLHDEKMKCFRSLARGVTEEEFTDFEAYDLSREKEMCIARSKIHPGEK